MNLNWSNKVIKYVLFVFNLLFVITGIVMIAVGVSVKSYYTDYDIFLNDSYFSLPNLLIAIGSLIFFISFFGCCGAIRESWFMIFIFSILLSIIFIMELSAGIAGYVLRDQTADFLKTELQGSMAQYEFNKDNPNAATYMWDKIQSGFQCCGATGPTDWPKIPHGKNTTTTTTTTTTISPTTTTTTISPTTTVKSSTAGNTSENSTNTTQPTTNSSTIVISTPTPTVSTKSPDNGDTPSPAKLIASMDNDDLPSSCCLPKPGATGITVCNINNNNNSTSYYFKQGCVDGFGEYLKDHAVTIGGVGLAIAFIQLFGVIFACHLSKQLKHGFYST